MQRRGRLAVAGATATAAVIGAGVWVACACTLSPPITSFPCTPTSFNAANPAASGYQVVFQDDFTNSSTIDMSDTVASGFHWYRRHWFGAGSQPAGDIVTGAGGLTLTPTSNAFQMAINTAAPNNSKPNQWVGTAFYGGAFFEARIAIDGAGVLSCFNSFGGGPCGWPAFWALGIEHSSDARSTYDQWPGQAVGFEHFIESDFFEYDVPTLGGGAAWGSGLVDWSGPGTNTCNANYEVSGYCRILNQGGVGSHGVNNIFLCGPSGCNTIWNLTTFHTLGSLWVSAEAANGQIGYSQIFLDGAEARTSSGANTSKTSWTKGTMPTPANLPNDPQVWSIFDYRGVNVILGSGTANGANNMPMKVQFVKVWQIPGCGTMVVQ